MSAKKAKEITRSIPREVERDLWVRAGGRCQFKGHNAILYLSPMTQRGVNVAQKAHIYSFSVDGPRGHGPYGGDEEGLNNVDNLMLVCAGCHKEIDDDDGAEFPVELLQGWKREHEERVEIVTGIPPLNRSRVVIYAEKIGEQGSAIHPQEANAAIFPDRFPIAERPSCVSMTWEGRDTDPDYWRTAETNLRRAFDRQIAQYVSDGEHLSLFGFAPMPLLVLFGSLFTDKASAQTHQLRREPERSWKWIDKGPNLGFRLHQPPRAGCPPALVFSISAKVDHGRVHEVLGADVSVWEITVESPHNDCLTTREQLGEFRKACRKAMVEISQAHGHATPLHVFPAMPVSAAVEFGRIRMPKADMPWEIHDHNRAAGKFVHALSIR